MTESLTNLASAGARLPRVSVVVGNFNQAAFVAEAIRSVAGQTYKNLDIAVVDDASTDDSHDRIAGCLAELGDDRIRFVPRERNAGQMATMLAGVEATTGSFVAFLDGDDFWTPDFVDRHVRAHLSPHGTAAISCSNLALVDSEGTLLSGSWPTFLANDLGQPKARLEHPSVAAAGEGDETLLFVKPGVSKWIWSATSGMMFRRDVVEAMRPGDPGRIRVNADNYFARLAQMIGGSVILQRTLGCYRLHSANSWATGRFFGAGSRVGVSKPGAMHEIEEELIATLCERARELTPKINRRELGMMLAELAGPERVYDLWSTNEGAAFLLRDWAKPAMRRRMRLLRLLPRSLQPKSLRFAPGFPPREDRRRAEPLATAASRPPRQTRGERLPLKPRLRLLGGALGWKTGGRGGTKAKKKGGGRKVKRAQESHPDDSGPAAVLSRHPPVLISGIAHDLFLGIAPAFGKRYGDVAAGFIIFPTWSIENPGRTLQIAAAAAAHRQKFRNHRLQFIGNTRREADLLSLAGEPAIHLNKNFTVSDSIFRLLPDAVVAFDAIYNARFVPEKRHELTAALDRVAYVAYVEGWEENLQDQRNLLAATLARNPSHRLLNPLVDGLPVRLSHPQTNAALNRAAVGLCLSAEEGSSYASMEYMLAGLPVVSTPSRGGRDVFFDPEYCLICEPDAAAVRDAVAALKARKIPREHVRSRTLAKIEPDRRRFLTLVDDMIASLGGERRFDGPWPFGETSGISWKAFQEHLLDFEQKAAPDEVAKEFGVEAADLANVQLHPAELRPIVQAIASRPGCSLLVFGCGNDSVFWEKINRQGTTAFLEDSPEWLELARSRLTTGQAYAVRYGTRLSEWQSLLDSPEKLGLELPAEISSRRWDVVLVDGPAGYTDDGPGRMKSIYAASRLVAPGGCVFVHDCDRPAERHYAARYLENRRLFVEAKGRSVLNGYAF